MNIDWSTYKTIDQLEKDIESIKIQGATNVALAVVHGMDMVINEYRADPIHLIENVVFVGRKLANARKNEPLARNAVKYLEVFAKMKVGSTKPENISSMVSQINADYLKLITESKEKMVKTGSELESFNGIFTHCHSSSVEKLIINLSEKNKSLKVACSETRPLFQGRITATNLNKAGLDTTLIVDSASETFVVNSDIFKVDCVFIGADEISLNGDLINKLGSFGIAVAANMSGVPLYVVASLLKINPETAFKDIEIEQRNPYEVWETPPKGLKIYNPAFEKVSSKLITGFITEVGILKPEELALKLHETYDFVF